MPGLGSIGVVELMTILCFCCIPIMVAVGVVIGLVVFMARRKPNAALEKAVPQGPAPASKAQRVATLEAEPAPGSRAVSVSDLATRSCPSCGTDNPADNSFCEYCGAALGEE